MLGSTIGAAELNFSVRNGKRWILHAIATRISTAGNPARALPEQEARKQRMRALRTLGQSEISDR